MYTKLQPVKLLDSLSKYVNFDGSIQFYYPYRGYRTEIMQVVLDSPFSTIFDVTQKRNVLYFNKESEAGFILFANRFFKGDIDKAQEFAINKIEKYKNAGIDAIVKGKDFMQIQTMYMDSSYALLKEVNHDYNDSFYLRLIKQNSDLNGYCLAFYFFDKGQKVLPFKSQRNITKVNDTLYYYREPIRGI